MRIHIAPAYRKMIEAQFNDAQGDYGKPGSIASPLMRLWGAQIFDSNLFPTRSACPECHGSGEGKTSTYCSKCGGAGALKAIGWIEATPSAGGSLITTHYHEKAFLPSFPRGLVRQPPMCRGLV